LPAGVFFSFFFGTAAPKKVRFHKQCIVKASHRSLTYLEVVARLVLLEEVVAVVLLVRQVEVVGLLVQLLFQELQEPRFPVL
jgi:hypothetical protein